MQRRRFVFAGLAALVTGGVAACAPVQPLDPGPPAHAPAHGYRRRHPSGVDLVYDRSLGVYVVLGYSQTYFSDRFYRLRGSTWQASQGPGGPWQTVSPRSIPPGLRGHPGDSGRGRHGGGPRRPPSRRRGR